MIPAIVVECPQCGRKMPSYRDICFKCEGIEVRDTTELVKEFKEAKEAEDKRLGCKPYQVVPQEVIDQRHAEQEYIAYYYPEHYTNHLPTDDWYMNASYKIHSDIEPRNTECNNCCSPEFCKNCFSYDRFNWHNSCNQDTAIMTGCTLEDVAKWYDSPVSDRWFPLKDKNGNIIEENVAKMDQVSGRFEDINHSNIIDRECAAYNRAYSQSLEGEDTWFRMQRLIEEDKLDIADEYSLKLALKKSKVMVPYILDEDGNPQIDINSLAMTPDEARGRSGTKNHARRITVLIPGEDAIVKVTNIGTNPYTHEEARGPIRNIDYNTIRVDGEVIEDALEPLRKFYGQFNMHKHNYQGTVNKKSDGRCPRTGCYPDPKSEDMMQLYRHTPSIIITPNVKIQETQHIVKFAIKGGLQEDKEISKVTRGEDCECGCNVKVKDMRRGEVICPNCGLVFHRDTIVG